VALYFWSVHVHSFKYYWVITPVNTEIVKISCNSFDVYNREALISGDTELGAEGSIFYDMCHRSESLYDHSLWIFANDEFETQENANYFSDILCVIAEALYDIKISSPGLLIFNQETSNCVTKQPPNIREGNVKKGNVINKKELEQLFSLCRSVALLDTEKGNYFKSIFDYLRDIRRSPLFVSELALWSFLEHHWSGNNKPKTNVRTSLNTLLNTVCEREEKRVFSKMIEAVGKDLGQDYNERVLRNILAHGKHFTLQKKWSEDNWTSFFKVHNELFSLIIRGLHREINAIKI
jgi:hypothetical protein